MIPAPLARAVVGIAFLATGCGAQALPDVDRLELIGGGGMGGPKLTVHLRRDGKGSFEIFDMSKVPAETKGEFTIAPERFTEMVAKLEPARRDARPATDISFIHDVCKAYDQVTDAGGFYVRWTGPGLDQHAAYNFGCGNERHKKRNARLEAILSELPIPPSRDTG